MPERLYAVDGYSNLFRAYHAIDYLSTSRGVPSHAVLILSTMLWKLIREEQPDYLGIASDAPGATFRDRLFDDYKATRTAMPPDLARQLPYVRRLYEALRLPVLEVPGFEADDVLATIARRTEPLGVDVVIVTGDKDMLQLVDARVTVLSVIGRTGEKVVYDAAKVRERWGVEASQIPDVLALMGDAIDNIPGVKGVGEKTAVKLLTQFGSVDRMYENLSLVTGKLRETLATNRKQALLSRELALLNREVPLEFDLAAFRRREPDWVKLRALWVELEFTRLLKELPTPTIEVSDEPVTALATPADVASYLERVPAGERLAVDWIGETRPPEPRLRALGLFHPAAGAAFLPLAAVPAMQGRELIVHDAKALLELLLAQGQSLPEVQDSAVAAYLLNPARSAYRLDEICMEAFGNCPVSLQGADTLSDEELAPRLGDRARWLWRFWEFARVQLDELGLRPIYEDIERPLVPVLARMERHGIRVDVERLEAFAKELERSLDVVTYEVYALAGEQFNIGSTKQLGQILFEKLKLPAGRKTKTGWSTDADVLTELAIGHELPAKILEHRSLAKLKSTYADALPMLIHPVTGRIHTSFNQLVAATGRLSCLPAGTLVSTPRGLIGIEEVRRGDFVHTPSGPRMVLDWERTGFKPVLAIRLSNGIVIRSSPEHKFRSLGKWVEAARLRVGDPVYMSFREGLFGVETALDIEPTAAYGTRKSPALPREWSVDLAELVGYFMADGCIARSNYNSKPAKVVLAFGWDEPDLMRHFADIIERVFAKTPVARMTRSCPVLEVSGVDIGGFFEQVGAGGLSGAIRVPPSLYKAPAEIIAAFLRGYFEGDGCAAGQISVRSVARGMLEDVQQLLVVFGIPTGLSDGRPDPRGYAPRHTLRILGKRSKQTFVDRIGFISRRKREQSTTFAANRSAKVASELLTLPDPEDVLRVRSALYRAERESTGNKPQALYVFAHKYATGRQTITLPRVEQLRESLRATRSAPAFFDEVVEGQYFQVAVIDIESEPAVPMYEIMVDGEQYVANGILVHNSADPNLQNIPIRTELGRRIRAAFIPEEGWKFVAADYSQIELRILAHCSGEESIVEAFQRDEDIHTRTAAEVLRAAPEAVPPEARRIAKMINYAVIYGVSAFGLSQNARIPQDEAGRYIRAYFAAHPKVRAFIDRTVAEGRERGYVTTILGRRRYLPDLNSSNPVARNAAERMAMNAPIQGSSADMIKVAMVRVDDALRDRGLRTRMLLQVHDELLFESPPDEVDALQALVREVMESAMPLVVPSKVDIKVGDDWSQV